MSSPLMSWLVLAGGCGADAVSRSRNLLPGVPGEDEGTGHQEETGLPEGLLLQQGVSCPHTTKPCVRIFLLLLFCLSTANGGAFSLDVFLSMFERSVWKVIGMIWGVFGEGGEEA